jgi:7-carboxy-7-deazaguanine synthase (Cx14CxxC type)
MSEASMYSVKEIFYTLQGEGANAGTPAVFCRFTGCNLWSGREEDRAGAACQFCDTDFIGTDGDGGGKFATAADLARACASALDGATGPSLIVLTGGEPMLQVDQPLLDALHDEGFAVAVETNGTLPVPDDVDWICVSPKAGADLKQMRGDELKLVFPQPALLPDAVRELDFDHFFLQPMDGPAQAENTEAAIAYCKAHPPWRLSVQTHKILGIR